MFIHSTQVRVRYGETDQMGYLYYGNYALYYEVGRAEAIRSLGFTYKDMEEKHGILMPVVALESRYLRPALYDDLITIRTEIRQTPTDYISFHHELYNEANKLLNGGKVRLAFVDKYSMKRCQAPDWLQGILKNFF